MHTGTSSDKVWTADYTLECFCASQLQLKAVQSGIVDTSHLSQLSHIHEGFSTASSIPGHFKQPVVLW